MSLYFFPDKPKAYVPPALRDNPQMVTSPKYREDYELPSNAKKTIGESGNLLAFLR